MFKGLGESTPQQIVDFISAVTSANGSCSRVIADRLSLEAHAKTSILTAAQSASLLQMIAAKITACGGSEVPPNGNGSTIPPPPTEVCKGTYICSIPDMWLYGGLGILALMMMKR